MTELLTTVPLVTIILILIVCIPQLIKFVNWIISIVKRHNNNQQEAFEAGREAEQEEFEEEQRFEAGEKRIGQLEEKESNLEIMMRKQQEQIDSLVTSDNLNIKSAIKRTWEKVVQFNQPIDAYDLSVLEDRYKLYASRGGNSWAHDMMVEIRRKATTTSPAPLAPERKHNDED